MVRRAAVLLPLLVLACSSGNPTGSGSPRVDTSTLFMVSDPVVYSVRPAWSPDGKVIAFSAGVRGHSDSTMVFGVSASGGQPYRLSGPDSYTPCYLGNGDAAWYQGWIDPDRDMHVMAAGQVLRRFNGSDVGWQVGAGASPGELSLCSSGLHALVVWDTAAWCLNWSGGIFAARQVDEVVRSGAVAPSGDRIAYSTADGAIVVAGFDGTGRTQVGSGSNPTWATQQVIGYVAQGGSGYVVHDLDSGTTTTYPWNYPGQPPALSPAADAVAYRVWSGDQAGIAVARLRD